MRLLKPFILIQLRPEDKASDSEYNVFLKVTGLDKQDLVRFRGEKVSFKDLDLSKYSGVFVGGSPFDVTTPEEKKTDVQKRVEEDFSYLIPKIIKEDFPFLGACSGNGLLSLFANGVMSKKYGEPVGGVDIYLTEEGKKDKLLSGFPDKFRAMVGHKEACEVPPPSAKVLAYSKTCPIQMMRIGEKVYSTQFHPEADAQEIMLRIDIYRNYGYFPPEAAEELKAQVAKEKVYWPQKILQGFVEIYGKKA